MKKKALSVVDLIIPEGFCQFLILSSPKEGTSLPLRRWLPSFYAEKHPELLKDYEKKTETDFTFPMILGCAEVCGLLEACCFKLERLSSGQSMAMEAVEITTRFLSDTIKNITEKSGLNEKPLEIPEIDALFHSAIANIKDHRNVAYLQSFCQTKSIDGQNLYAKSIVNTLLLIRLLSQEDFERTMVELFQFICKTAAEIQSECSRITSERDSGASGKQILNSFSDVVLENMEDGKKFLGSMDGLHLMLSSSVNRPELQIEELQKEFFTIRKPIKILCQELRVWDSEKEKFLDTLTCSDCTTSVSGVFCLFLACVLSQNSINLFSLRPFSFYQEMISAGLGMDDCGKFLKTGKYHERDLQGLGIGGSLVYPIRTRRSFYCQAVSKVYCGQMDDIPAEDSFFIYAYKYFDIPQFQILLNYTKSLFVLYPALEHNSQLLDTAEQTELEKEELKRQSNQYRATLSDLSEKSDRIKGYEEKIRSLEAQVTELQHVLASKTAKIAELQEKDKRKEKESPLQEMEPKEMEEPLEEELSLMQMKERLESLQILFVGGRMDMEEQMKKKGYFLPNATQILKQNQDWKFPKDPDIVCYLTKFLSHAMFQAVKAENFPSEMETNFNGTNLDQLISHLYHFAVQSGILPS